MSTSAVIMMVFGLVVVWGGLAVAIAWAVRTHRQRLNDPEARPYGAGREMPGAPRATGKGP